MAKWPEWSPAPTWPRTHLLGGAPYIPASSHSDLSEFRARMKRRQEDADRRRAEQRRECDEEQA